jgi:ketosteroid isomerase-like protein
MATALDPRAAFDRMRRHWLEGAAGFQAEDLAQDVVIETPFSPPGARRIEGRDNWLAFAEPRRAALPVRFDDCREIAIHQTADPEMIIAEYELTATLTSTGQRSSAAFIAVLKVRDGKTVLWREYQNVLAMSLALGTLPQVVQAYQAAANETAPAG